MIRIAYLVLIILVFLLSVVITNSNGEMLKGVFLGGALAIVWEYIRKHENGSK